MKLTTEALILRTVGPEDAAEVARMWDFENGPIPMDEAEQVLARMEENHRRNEPGHIHHLCLAVTEKTAPQRIVGWCGLDGTSGGQLHIFYSIVPECRGQGYATQAAKALLRYAFTQAEVPFVNGGCCRDNRASYRVMEKAGMARAGAEENGDPLFSIDRETYLRKWPIGWARLAGPDDCPAVHRLLCQLEDTELPYGEFERIYRSQIEDKRYLCLVWQLDGRTIGVVNLRIEEQLHHCGRVAEILELSVDPAMRSKGIGRSLLQRAGECAADQGCVLLEAASSRFRSDAHRFYLREGMEWTHDRFSRELPR